MDDPRNPIPGSLPGAPIANQPPRPTAPSPAPAVPPRPVTPPITQPLQQKPPVAFPPKPATTPVPDLRFLDKKIEETTPVGSPAAPRPPVFASPAAPAFPTPPRPVTMAPPRPAVPPTAPSGPAQPPPAPQVRQQEFKTTIRTLGGDLEKIKVGQQPSGLDIQKTIIPGVQAPPTPSAPTQPQGPTKQFQVGLGQAERSRGLPVSPEMGGTRRLEPGAGAPEVSVVEPPSRRSHLPFLLLVLFLVLVGGGIYYYLTLSPDLIVEGTPSPTQQPSPSPVKTLNDIFTGTSEPVMLVSSGNPTSAFHQSVRGLSISGAQFRKLAVKGAESSQELSPVEIFDRFLVTYPAGLDEYLGEDMIVLVFGQQEKFDTKGQLIAGAPIEKRLVFISEVTNIASASNTVTKWEATMAQTLSGLFGISQAKAATPAFLNNIRQNASVRYKNFPFPDLTIDYTQTNASNGKVYFILANSREAVFSAIDTLKR